MDRSMTPTGMGRCVSASTHLSATMEAIEEKRRPDVYSRSRSDTCSAPVRRIRSHMAGTSVVPKAACKSCGAKGGGQRGGRGGKGGGEGRRQQRPTTNVNKDVHTKTMRYTNGQLLDAVRPAQARDPMVGARPLPRLRCQCCAPPKPLTAVTPTRRPHAGARAAVAAPLRPLVRTPPPTPRQRVPLPRWNPKQRAVQHPPAGASTAPLQPSSVAAAAPFTRLPPFRLRRQAQTSLHPTTPTASGNNVPCCLPGPPWIH